jgi:hypothetical protein
MDRDDVTRSLHQLAHATVCGEAPWPASLETRISRSFPLHRLGDSRERIGMVRADATVQHMPQ